MDDNFVNEKICIEKLRKDESFFDAEFNNIKQCYSMEGSMKFIIF